MQANDTLRPAWARGIEAESSADLSRPPTEDPAVEDPEDDSVTLSRAECQQVPESEQVYQVSVPKHGTIDDFIKKDYSHGLEKTEQDVRARRVKTMIDKRRSGTTKVAASPFKCVDDYFLEGSRHARTRRQKNKGIPESIDVPEKERVGTTNQDLVSVESEIPMRNVKITNDTVPFRPSLLLLVDPGAKGTKRVALDLTGRAFEQIYDGVSWGIKRVRDGIPSLIKTAVINGGELLHDSMTHPEGHLHRASVKLNQQIGIQKENLEKRKQEIRGVAAKKVKQGLQLSKREFDKCLGYIPTEEVPPNPVDNYLETEDLVQVGIEHDLIGVEQDEEVESEIAQKDGGWMTTQVVKRIIPLGPLQTQWIQAPQRKKALPHPVRLHPAVPLGHPLLVAPQKYPPLAVLPAPLATYRKHPFATSLATASKILSITHNKLALHHSWVRSPFSGIDYPCILAIYLDEQKERTTPPTHHNDDQQKVSRCRFCRQPCCCPPFSTASSQYLLHSISLDHAPRIS